jgi:mRNA interferase MazF
MTTKSRPAPFRVPVTFDRRKGLILLDQIRTVDKVRLVKRAGAIAERTLTHTLHTLQEVFAE